MHRGWPGARRPRPGALGCFKRLLGCALTVLLQSGFEGRLGLFKRMLTTVLRVTERLEEGKYEEPAGFADEDGDGSVIAVVSRGPPKSRFQLASMPRLGSIEEHRAVVPSGQPVLLDIGRPVGAVRIDDEEVLFGTECRSEQTGGTELPQPVKGYP